jgi:hypothetical protein
LVSRKILPSTDFAAGRAAAFDILRAATRIGRHQGHGCAPAEPCTPPAANDHAIGVVCTGLEMMDLMQNQRIKQSDGPHARLMRSLPAWMLAAAVPER